MNDPSGRAQGSYQEQQYQGGGSSSPDSTSSHNMHVHHPGHEAEVEGLQGGGGGSSPSSAAGGSGGSNAASTGNSNAGSSGGRGPDSETGLPEGAQDLSVNPAGSERAVTPDFAAGGDDVAPAAEGPAELHDSPPVNPTSGLPAVDGAGAAGASSGRFGGLQDASGSKEEGVTARQTEKSTGMDPGDLASG